MNVVTTDNRRGLLRQISGLGMEDPIFKTRCHEWPTHPSIIYDDMSYKKVPDDMKDLVTVDSDPTDPVGGCGLDESSRLQTSILSMSCFSTLLSAAKGASANRSVASLPHPSNVDGDEDDNQGSYSVTEDEAKELCYRSLCSLTVEDLELPRCGAVQKRCHPTTGTDSGSSPAAAHVVSPGSSPSRAARSSSDKSGRSAARLELSLPSLSNDAPPLLVVRPTPSRTVDPSDSLESFHESLYSLLASQDDLSLADADESPGTVHRGRSAYSSSSSSEELLLRELSQSLTKRLHVTKESLRPPTWRQLAADGDGASSLGSLEADATTSAGVVVLPRYRYPPPGTDAQLPGGEVRALPSLVDLFPPLPARLS